MARIAIDARESGSSTGRYIDKLIEYLHQLKPKHQVVILTKEHRVDFFNKIAPKFEVVVSPHKEFTFAEQIGLYRQLRDMKADLVHFGMVQQPLLYRGKTVTTMHDLITVRYRNPAKNWLVFTIKQQVYKWLNRRVAHKANVVIVPTEYVKDDVARFAGINSSKIRVTYESADAITEKPETIDVLENKRFIMYIGRPTPHKNLPRLIEAFVSLRQQHPDLWLVLAGKKDVLYRQIEKDVERQSTQHVLFTGFVSEGQLRWLYEHTAAYVFPSLSEGFGLPGLEAMVHGAPVASSDATCLPEVYKDGAVYFDPNNVEDMAEKINLVLTHPRLANELKLKSAKVAKQYSWQRMAEQTLAIYNEILDS